MIRIHTIPLNIGDFLTDILEMDTREIGAYTCLFIAHIQAGEDGITCDERKLALMARVTDKVWKNGLGISVLRKFHMVPHPTNNPALNRWVNDHCLEVIKRVDERSAINKANALKRWDRDNTTAFPLHRNRNANQRQRH